MSPLLLVKSSHYSFVVVQPFRVGLVFHIPSHQATSLSKDWFAVADFCARPTTNYSTILSLILLLLLDFHHSNLGPQLDESKTIEWLGEDVCELSFGFDKL